MPRLRDEQGRLTMFSTGLLLVVCGAILYLIDHFGTTNMKSVIRGTDIRLETFGIAAAVLGAVIAIGAWIAERRRS